MKDCTALETERIKTKPGQKKMVTRITLSGECFNCAQIKDKMKKKIYYISYLREPRKRQRKKNDVLLNFRTMKSNAVCNFGFIISHHETGLCLQEKTEI